MLLMLSWPLLLQPRKSELLWGQTPLRRGISTPAPSLPGQRAAQGKGSSPYRQTLGINFPPSLVPALSASLPFQKSWRPSTSRLGAKPSAASRVGVYWMYWCWGARARLWVMLGQRRGREKELARRKGLFQWWWGIGKQINTITGGVLGWLLIPF